MLSYCLCVLFCYITKRIICKHRIDAFRRQFIVASYSSLWVHTHVKRGGNPPPSVLLCMDNHWLLFLLLKYLGMGQGLPRDQAPELQCVRHQGSKETVTHIEV